MPIFDQGYQHWQGRLSIQVWRWVPITLQGTRVQLKNRWVRWVVLAALVPALLLSAFLALWGLFEQQSSLLTPYLMLFQGLPDALRSGPRGYRSAFWTLAFRQFFGMQLFLSMILVLLVGPDLISQDLRFNAIPLYLSRPVRRFEYFLGKMGVIAVYLSVVAIVPVLVAYALGFGFSLDPTVFRDTARLLCASLAYGLIIVVSAGLLMLALSSLSRNSRYVGAMWLGLWLIGDIASGVMVLTVRADWCPLVSYTQNLDRLRDALIGAEPAARQVMDLFNAGQEGLNRSPFSGPLGRGGVLSARGARAQPANSPTGPLTSTGASAHAPRRRRLAFAPAEYPWQWSAGVLAALAAISCVILTTRVRSLDRLR
jgi:ABC-2 type transport system permease protein